MSFPTGLLSQRTTLVTAASRKLGASIAIELGRRGARVAVNYHRSEDAAQAVVAAIRQQGGEAVAIQADVSDPIAMSALVNQTIDHFGALDILVNNAGPYIGDPLKTLSVPDWDWILNTNVRASFFAAQQAFPSMQARGWGRIINISAGSAFVRNHSIYGLAKNTLVTLTQTLALEFAPHVTVNAIAPGLIDDPEVPLVDRESMRLDSPLQRLVTYQQVAEMVCLLCSPAFDLVTGQVITMDGGQTIPRATNLGT